MITAGGANWGAGDRAGLPSDLRRAIILRSDFVFLLLVLFTASGAVYRFGVINTYLWYGIYLWAAARFALELPGLGRAIMGNWAVFLWPALAIASVAWSLSPPATIRGGLQLLMTTFIAVFIGARFSLRQILVAIVAVLSATLVASIVPLFLNDPEVYNYSGGFRGTFAHKNTLGLRMNILLAAAILVFMAPGRLKTPMAVAIFLAVYGLILSQSATSQILALATPAVIALLWALRLGFRATALTSIGVLAVTGISLTAVFMSGADPVAVMLDRFGKDATLTGRTWLWEIGLHEISKHPILGGGYQAYWGPPQKPEVLWIRSNFLETVNGFHNVGIEVWNDLGIPGLVALFAVLLLCAWRAVALYRTGASALAIFPLFFLLILGVSAVMNNSFFRQHELVHILVCALYAASGAAREQFSLLIQTERRRLQPQALAQEGVIA